MNKHIVSKTTSGDYFIGVVLSENLESITIDNPLALKILHVQEDGELVEKTTLAPFCRYTEERIFMLNKKDLLYVKSLNPYLANYYDKVIESMDKEQELLEQMVEDLTDLEEATIPIPKVLLN